MEQARVGPEDVRSLADLERLPFTTREAWMECQKRSPPFGDMLARPVERAVRYHTTSGTTGRTPLSVLDGRADWKWIAECWCYGFHGFGVRATDRVFFAFSYGTFIGFWGAHYACEKMGCLVLPSRQHDHRGPRGADRRHAGHGGVRHAHLRAAPGAGGAREGRRPARRERPAADPLGRAGGLDPGHQAPDRGAVGRQGGRHGGHDRDRHDHDVRVREAARRHAPDRGPGDRGGDRPRDRPRRCPTASAASAWSPRSAAA